MKVHDSQPTSCESSGRPIPVVALVACSDFAPFQFSVPCAIFGNFIPRLRLFDLRICTTEQGPIRNEFGMVINAEYGIEGLTDADVIIIPCWPETLHKPEEPFLDALRAASTRGALIVGLCLGSYPLAYAGLLDGRRASTHWEVMDDFRRRFPKVILDPKALYLNDGGLITSAGTGAGIDCCLDIVRSIHGSRIANQIAQRLVLPYFREGRETQFVSLPGPRNSSSSRIQRTTAIMVDNLAERYDTASLADMTGMSRRNFTRQFQSVTGMAWGQWLQLKRLQKVQVLLEDATMRVESIPELVGISSAVALRKQFRSEFGTSPSEWRRTRNHSRAPQDMTDQLCTSV
jgi:transcriptional regulator GlxA family with amidase domain